MNATVINNHHFCQGIKLEIVNGENKWSIEGEKQKTKYGTCIFGKPVLDEPEFRYFDPKNSMDDFVKLLNLIFEFTGCWYESEIIDGYVSRKEVLEHIYKTPLEQKVKFVSIGHCGCNMGHCGAVTGIEIKEYKTYGDIMELFSGGYKDEDESFYEYPDSVWIFIERIIELPKKIHSGQTCYSELIDTPCKLDDNQVYVSWSYSR